MKIIAAFFSLSVLFCFGCKKSSTGNNTAITPTNLNVTAVVSTDNSGNVAFTATATNAVSYDYDYGNGIFQTVASGIITYKYPASGTYTVTVKAKSSTGQTVSKSIQVTVSVALTLIWSEEFDVAGAPNSAKWGYDLGAGGWGNAELQNYTNRTDNAIVSNGTLKITAKAESYNGSAYTSARLLSKDKFSFKYGKIEARAKLPAGGGTWPAIWMLGNNINTVGWPACGEIDVMEHVGNQLNKIFGTVHHPGHSGGNADGGTVVISNATTEFHVYAAEWTASSIKFSVDGNVFYTFPNTSSLPFNQNFFIILNVAMGGNFGGAIDPAFTSASMEVDYVRVYQ
ncbi:MAG: Beta-glucanase precursor [Bacteroidota bacterium]|jgi:beta-glucanase (GH16 family)